MPLLPAVNTADVILYGAMTGIQDAAPLAAGVCNLASPINGKLKMFGICLAGTPDVTSALSIVTRHGTMATTFSIPSGSVIGVPIYFEVPLGDRANHVDAGEPFSFQSNGLSNAGGLSVIAAVIVGA